MLPKDVRYVDLSQALTNGIPLAGVLPRFSKWQCLELDKGDSVNCQALLISDHTGTHCDAPRHVFNEGKTIEQYPPDAYSGIALCLDVTNCDRKAITVEAIKEAEEKSWRHIQKNDIVLLYTDHSRHWAPIPEGYKYLKNRPCVDPAAAEYLIEKGIKCLGLDVGGPDPLGGDRHIIHEMLLSKDILIVESLTNLSEVANKEFYLCCFPVKFADGTGAPTRAVAMIDL